MKNQIQSILAFSFMAVALSYSQTSLAADYACISGGTPVQGDSCRAESYAGFSCPSGQTMCSPYLFGVQSSGRPFCYKSATTKSCYQRIKVGVESTFKPLYRSRSGGAALANYNKQMTSICSGASSVRESKRSLNEACTVWKKQSEVNASRNISIYNNDLSGSLKRAEAARVESQKQAELKKRQEALQAARLIEQKRQNAEAAAMNSAAEKRAQALKDEAALNAKEEARRRSTFDSASTSTSTSTPEKTIKLKGNYILRAESTKSSKRIGLIPNGQEAKLISCGHSDNRCLVEYNGVQGYIPNDSYDEIATDSTDRAAVSGQTVGDTTNTVDQKLDPAELARRQSLYENRIPTEVLKQNAAQLNSGGQGSGELGGGNQAATAERPAQYATPSVFQEEFPPRNAAFSIWRGRAKRNANASWESKSLTQRANYLHKKYDELLRAHNMRGTYHPSVPVCKAYRESTFDPQIKATTSSAVGISQVLRPTAKDTLSRATWFRSKVAGFTEIRNGETFYNRMAGSMVAQMELGLVVLDMKRRDRGLGASGDNINAILQGYYGNKNKAKNRAYAKAILDCARCSVKYGYTMNCLKKAQ